MCGGTVMVRPKKSLGKRSADAPPTWHATSNAWRKRLTVNGKQRQFRYKFPHTSEGRRKAADAWRREYLTLKTGTRLAELKQQADAILATLNDEQHPDWRHTWEYVAGAMKRGVSYDDAIRGAAHIVSGRGAVREGRYQHAAKVLEAAANIADPQPEPASIDDAEDQVSGILDLYLVAQKREHSLGNIGKLRFSSIRRWIDREKKSDLGLTTTPTDEDGYGQMLIAYRTRCEDELIKKQYGKPGFDDRMREMRKFVGWASENYKLPRMPRNVKSALGKFNEPGESAKSIPDDVLIRIAAHSSGWLRTAIALSLNCGFYASDFAYLSPGDIKDGHLHFVRGKTLRKAN